MLMVIDIGNTTIHSGIYSSGNITDTFLINHTQIHFNQTKSILIKKLKNFSVSRIALCSVVKNLEDKLIAEFKGYNIFTVKSDMKTGIKMDYSPVASLGVDRFANIVAFANRYDLPGAVIDIGSALTIDVIGGQKSYMGGLIFPGPGLCRDAVSAETDLLPRVEIIRTDKLFGNSTDESIQSGIYTGFKCMVTEYIHQLKKEFKKGCFTTVATGGWSSLWEDDLSCVNIFDRNFTLKGIGDIYHMFNSGWKT